MRDVHMGVFVCEEVMLQCVCCYVANVAPFSRDSAVVKVSNVLFATKKNGHVPYA